VDNSQLVALTAELGDIFAGILHHLQLGLGGGVAVSPLEGVSPQGNDDFGHSTFLLFFRWQKYFHFYRKYPGDTC
jgi:hypothetical protein